MQKAEPQHSPQQSQPAAKQGKGLALASPQGEHISQLEAMADASPQVDRFAQLAEMANDNALAAAQRRSIAAIHNSPRTTVQRQQLDGYTGETAQREEVQPKPNNTGLPDQLKNGIESLSDDNEGKMRPHNSFSQPSLLNAQEMGMIQKMSSGKSYDRRLLGAKAEEKTALKQWKSGEFYAWDRTNERKDHHHAHIYPATNAEDDEVTIDGHVVTAKGSGDDSNKRNQTSIRIEGIKGDNNTWQVQSEKGDERLELPKGSKEVPKSKHEEEELLIRLNLENATYYLLNTPDQELPSVDKAANKIERKLARKLARKRREREEAQDNENPFDNDQDIFGDMFQ